MKSCEFVLTNSFLKHLLGSPVEERSKQQSDGLLHVFGAQPAPLVPDQQAQDVQGHLSQRRLGSCVERKWEGKAEYHIAVSGCICAARENKRRRRFLNRGVVALPPCGRALEVLSSTGRPQPAKGSLARRQENIKHKVI